MQTNFNFADVYGVKHSGEDLVITLKSELDKWAKDCFGDPPHITLTGCAADRFLREYREHLSKNEKPEDRIIPGIDDQSGGVYCRGEKEQAIYKAKSLSEIMRPVPSANVVKFLNQAYKLLATAHVGSLDALAEIKKLIPELQSSWTSDDVDGLRDVIKGIGETVALVAKTKATLKKISEDYGL